MKRIALLVLALNIGFLGFAQKRAPISKDFKDVKVTREYKAPFDPEPPMINYNQASSGNLKAATLIGDETEIIETLYDLQTNSAVSNRLWAWDDGTIAGVCTRGIDQPAGFAFPDRGTGYNYFDGTAWAPKPSARVETIRTGWPSIAPLGANGECLIAHRSATANCVFSSRATKGIGPWTETTFPAPPAPATAGLLWPRMVTSGADNNFVHVFGLTAPTGNGGQVYQGQDGALIYFRSPDGGATWDVQGELLEGVGSDYYLNIGGDDYVMASNGDVVALLHIDMWTDMFLLKSSDNGSTWEKIMVWEHPYPFFDMQTTLMPDTLWGPDGSGSVAIDDNGMCHIVWGVGRAARLEAAPPDPGYFSYWPYTDAIGYWNESMGQIPENDNPHKTHETAYLESLGMLCGWTQDVNNSGFIFDYEGTGDPQFATYRSLGISTMPTITIDGSVIAVFYASTTETFTTSDGLYNYKHIWARTSPDLGYTWGEFYDMQAGNIFHIYDECIFPIASPKSPSGKFHLIYQADNLVDLYLDEDLQLEPSTNRIIYNGVAKDLIVGINDPIQNVNSFSVSQSYPNPTHGLTQIVVDLSSDANVSVEIVNMTGQKLLDIPAKNLQAGSHTLSINASGFSAGVYFYTVTAGAEKITRKMIVE